LWQPLVDRWRQKEAGRAIGWAEIGQGKGPEMGANRRYDSNVEPTEPPGIKSDRLLVPPVIDLELVL